MNFDEDWAPFGGAAAGSGGVFSSSAASSSAFPGADFPVGGPAGMMDTFPFQPKALGLHDGDLALDGSAVACSGLPSASAYQPLALLDNHHAMPLAGFVCAPSSSSSSSAASSSALPLAAAALSSSSSAAGSSSSAACVYEPFLMEPSPVAASGALGGAVGGVAGYHHHQHQQPSAFTFASVAGFSSSTETSPASPQCLSTPEEQASGCGADYSSDTSHDDDVKLPPMSPICLPPLDTPMSVAAAAAAAAAAGAASGASSSAAADISLTPRASSSRHQHEQLILVKQEPSDGCSSPSYSSVSSPTPSVPLPPAPPADNGGKKKAKKGRKRKAPPLLSDLDLSLDDDDDDLDDTSNLDKKERNKLSAAKYRKRKKLYIGKLEQLNSSLQSTLSEQKEKMAAMATENGVLKSQLVFFKKLLAQSNISLTDGRVPTSMAKQAGAVLFVLFSFFVITTPFWCSLDSPAAVTPLPGASAPFSAAGGVGVGFSGASFAASPSSSRMSSLHDHSVPGMKGRVLLSMNEDVSCECSGTSPMLDNLTSLLSQLQISAHGDVSLPAADAHQDVTFESQLLQLNASHVAPAAAPVAASA